MWYHILYAVTYMCNICCFGVKTMKWYVSHDNANTNKKKKLCGCKC